MCSDKNIIKKTFYGERREGKKRGNWKINVEVTKSSMVIITYRNGSWESYQTSVCVCLWSSRLRPTFSPKHKHNKAFLFWIFFLYMNFRLVNSIANVLGTVWLNEVSSFTTAASGLSTSGIVPILLCFFQTFFFFHDFKTLWCIACVVDVWSKWILSVKERALWQC